MKLNILKSVTIITPTIGSPKLADAMLSVSQQTYKNIKHLIVIDGPKFWNQVYEQVAKVPTYDYQITIAPECTGAGGFYGHRIYAGYPHLINSDYIFFLDEDNWYEPDHVKSLVEVLERDNNRYAYSLRNIYSDDKTFICQDNCESLGKWPIFFDENRHLIDTSSYAFHRDFLVQTCHLWHHGWGGDRRFYSLVRDNPHDTNGKYTLCYRLDGNEGSVKPDFFANGNDVMQRKYDGIFPWAK